MRKKYLIFSLAYPPLVGGIERYIYSLSKKLHSQNVKLTVLTEYVNDCELFDKQNNFRIIRMSLPRNKISKLVDFSKILFSLFKSQQFDCVIIAHWFCTGLIIGPCLVSFCKLFNIPYFIIAYGREILIPQKRVLLKKVMVYAFNNSRLSIAISNNTKKILIAAGVKTSKIYVIPSGIDMHGMKLRQPSKKIRKYLYLNNKKILLSVSRLIKRKGHDMVLKSLPQVIRQIPEIQYVIVGEGPEENRLKKITRKLNLDSYVDFVGYLSDEDLFALYNLCDIFIMPSREILEHGEVEGFGIVYLEAAAFGKPVIGGDSGGVNDAVINGETGILVNPLDVYEISKAIVKLCRNPNYACKLGRQGKERVEAFFSWDVVSRRINNLIEQSIQK